MRVRMSWAALLPRSGSRTARVTEAPAEASAPAVASPSPELAPVTMAVRPWRAGMSAAVQRGMVATLPAREGSGIRACP